MICYTWFCIFIQWFHFCLLRKRAHKSKKVQVCHQVKPYNEKCYLDMEFFIIQWSSFFLDLWEWHDIIQTLYDENRVLVSSFEQIINLCKTSTSLSLDMNINCIAPIKSAPWRQYVMSGGCNDGEWGGMALTLNLDSNAPTESSIYSEIEKYFLG